ncbi:putative membrane protein [Paenibacillus endophyticus]|uniref:Putative membrane protein n=1 Tax=Paenibacillus endophyticus TaxID=1294268 RepID=A0A7W5C7V5_9BACL|nr:PH domain-containing protein [Paenibacillus endophyticus]MBB3152602.1 putative membrane protein [Paenibacillus endophyticus]
MNERRTLHPIYILFGLLNTIRGFIPFILIGLLRGTDWTGLEWYWYAGVSALSAVILVFSYIEWKSFGFWLESDRIIIRKGWLFRDEKTIYYTRIHSVNVEQPLVQRLLKVAQVKIETPGGNKKADGVLPALSLKEASDIQLMLKKQASVIAAPEGQPLSEKLMTQKPEADEQLVVRINQKPLASESVSHNAERGPSIALHAGQLLQAAATSMNFGLVAAFMAGLYSFANDFINQLLPDHFFESVVEDSSSFMPSYFAVVIVVIAGVAFAWLLSIILYVLKFSGFAVQKDGRQISVSYGLLEKKSFVFDPKKVQAVIVSESWLRQAFGYAEIRLQIVSSDKKEQLMLHPFIKRSDIQQVLNDFVPQIVHSEETPLQGAPKRALLYYIRIELLIAALLCAASIIFLKEAGLWSLVLIPLVLWWRRSCYVAAGVSLRNGQLTLRTRFLSRSTFLIRRPQIVTMRVNRSIGQQRKNLLTLSVRALGSPFEYRVKCLDHADVEPVWRWYSRSQN